MNIYSGDKKEEKKSNLTRNEMEKIPYNLHFQILEKFLHNIAGKINVCNFLFEMDADKSEVKKVFAIIESMLLLYRGILLNRSDINIPSHVFVKLVEDKRGKCVIEDFSSHLAEKAFLLVILYNTFSSTSELIVGENSLVLKDKDIHNVISLLNKYTESVTHSRFQFLNKYLVEENKIIFNF